MKLRVGIVGNGFIAKFHMHGYREAKNVELVACCDLIEERAKTFAETWGFKKTYVDYRKMLAEGDQARIQEIFKQGDWNELVVRCSGKHIQIWLNGLLTVDYTEADDKISPRGVIGLQVHGGKPAEAWYKDIRIKELTK